MGVYTQVESAGVDKVPLLGIFRCWATCLKLCQIGEQERVAGIYHPKIMSDAMNRDKRRCHEFIMPAFKIIWRFSRNGKIIIKLIFAAASEVDLSVCRI